MWALGCILYEMLTGRRAFDGADVSDVFATVLKSDPDWSALPADVPPHVEWVLRGCLQKDRAKRAADAAVVRFALEGPPALAPRTPSVAPSRARVWMAVAAAALVGAALASFILWVTLGPAPADQAPMRFAVVTTPNAPLVPQGNDRDIAISPDGRWLVYRTSSSNTGQLAVRDLTRLDTLVLHGTDNARWPFFSPDGQWIAFFAEATLRKVAISGGAVVTLCAATGAPRGGSWDGDRIVFATSDSSSGLLAVPATGGEPTVLSKPVLDRGEMDHVHPYILPGGERILFTAEAPAGAASQIGVLEVASGQTRVIAPGTHPQLASGNFLVFSAAGGLRAAQFDTRRGELLSEAIPVIDGVARAVNGTANYALSRLGTLLYLAGSSASDDEVRRRLVWLARDGSETPADADARAYADPRVSPDGRHVAVEVTNVADDIWTLDVARGALTRQTFEVGEDETPVWLPDGRTLVYASTRRGLIRAIHRRRVDGVGTEELLWKGEEHVHIEGVTPDGRALLVASPRRAGAGLAKLPLDGNGVLEPLWPTAFYEHSARVSPDGRWIAYVSNETGREEVFVRAFPSFDQKVQVSTEGGHQPVWSRRGDELFYRHEKNMMSVRFQAVGVDRPQKLFQWEYFGKGANHTSYDVTPDGRFLMVKDVHAVQGSQTSEAPYVVVVLNWMTEVQQRLGHTR